MFKQSYETGKFTMLVFYNYKTSIVGDFLQIDVLTQIVTDIMCGKYIQVW